VAERRGATENTNGSAGRVSRRPLRRQRVVGEPEDDHDQRGQHGDENHHREQIVGDGRRDERAGHAPDPAEQRPDGRRFDLRGTQQGTNGRHRGTVSGTTPSMLRAVTRR